MRKVSLRSWYIGFAAVAVAMSLAAGVGAGPKDTPKGGKAAAQEAEPPTVPSLAPMLEGIKWGQSPQDVITAHNSVGGIFDKDYDPLLVRVQPGVQQKALEADRDNKKLALQNSLVAFKDTPTGYDATPLKGEYSYRNKESLLTVERQGRKRYFFFIGAPARLWKVYDEVALDETSPLGKTYTEAITKLQAALGVVGRVRATDREKGLSTTTVDWQDATTHLRALDRGRIVAVVMEERNTLANIDRMRANKPEDPLAMDPSISAVTKGGISDPNARPQPNASASASGKKNSPPPPKN